MNRFRILGLFLLLLLPSWVKSINLHTSASPISHAWGSILATSRDAYDFLIYDAVCSQSRPALFIVGKSSSTYFARPGENAYFYSKDEYTDAFLACMSLEGELLWSTFLPALEEGYYNAFATTVEYTEDSTILVIGNAYQIQDNLENTQNLIPKCPGNLFVFEFDLEGKLLRSKVLPVRYRVGGALLPLYIPRIVKTTEKPQVDNKTAYTFSGFGLSCFTENPTSEESLPIFYYSLPVWADFSWQSDIIEVKFISNITPKLVYIASYALSLYSFDHLNLYQQHGGTSLFLYHTININEKNNAKNPQSLFSRGIDLLEYVPLFEQWDITTGTIELDEHIDLFYGFPTGTHIMNTAVNDSPHKQIFPGTVQNIHAYKNKYIVQGIYCQNYSNGFFKQMKINGQLQDYTYSHDSTHPIPAPQKGFYQHLNKHLTAVPYLLLYDSATLFGPQDPELPTSKKKQKEENTFDFEAPFWGSYLEADWLYEDFFHVTDSAQWKDIYQPYEPVLCSYGDMFFFIGNAKKISGDLMDNPTMTEEIFHHQGVVLAFSTELCPPEKTAFQDVRFLCPDDSVELILSSDYDGFKFRFDSIFLTDGSIVLNTDSTRAWAKKEGIFTATLDGSNLGCPDVAVDTMRITLSPYPEPISALNPDSTIAACAAVGVMLQAVTEPDTSFSYRWFDGDSLAEKNIRFNGDSLFFASVEANGYCTSFRDSIQLRFLPPYVNLGPDTTICQLYVNVPQADDTLMLLSAAQDYFPQADWYFQWQINGKNAGNDARIAVRKNDLTEDSNGHKKALVVVQVALSDTNINSCIATDSLSISWFGTDTIANHFLPLDTLLCAHLDLSLQLPPQADDFHCYWLDMDSVPMPYGYDTNRFTIIGMRGADGFGNGADARIPRRFQLSLLHRFCPDWHFFDTITIFDILKPAISLPFHDTLLCRGIPVEMEVFEPHVYKDFYSFLWNDGIDSVSRQFTDSGNFVLMFSLHDSVSTCGYGPAADSLHILAPAPLLTDINLPEDTSFCKKLSVVLDASVPYPSTRYSWQEGNLDELFSPLDDSTLFTSPVIKVDKEVSLALFVVDSLGCVNTRQIDVNEEDCKPVIEIPNVFTPNGDGVNDVLKFKQLEKCFHVEILIVNRKGNHVLHKKVNDIENFSWNGCLDNGSRKLPDGPYFYLITYKDAYGKKKVQSGSITILGSHE